MRICMMCDATGQATAYSVCLSAADTERWATRPGAAWPCSALRGRRLMAAVDANGLWDLIIDGEQDCPGDEVAAIIADHLPAECRHLWPIWATQKESP